MKLLIKRDKASGMFGGVKYELSAKVELTSTEADVIRKYKSDKEVLLKKEIK